MQKYSPDSIGHFGVEVSENPKLLLTKHKDIL
jgi:hypothetical protein